MERCYRVNNDNTNLVTFDVISLYANIPHAYKLELCLTGLFVLESARLIPEHSKFNDEFFVQINGTAMGTIFAPTYATLRVGYFELTLCIICINVFSDQFVFKN